MTTTSSELPEATSLRWQPLRCGLINVYRYDNEEFRFERGRLLLRGNNGTGKSRVLALQLPFLLDGEVDATRLEPDGDRAKRFEWNLLMNRHENRVGYTWLEFGRRDEDGRTHYWTLGCGMSAWQGRPSVNKWFFLTRRRVGADLQLLSEARVPLGQDALKLALAGEGELYTTAVAYREAVDRALFRLGRARYEALVNLLITLRTPKLQRKLDEDELSSALSEALAPLPARVVDDVAESFRSLEDDQRALANFEEALRSVDAFLVEYRRYCQIATRRRADAVRKAHSNYEAVGRDLVERRAAHEGAERAVADNVAAQSGRKEELTEVSARIEVLEDSPQMRDARDLERAAQDATTARAAAQQVARDHDAARRALTEAQARVQRTAAAARKAREALDARLLGVLEAARAVGLESFHVATFEAIDVFGEPALERPRRAVESELRRRREAAVQLQRRCDAVRTASSKHDAARQALTAAEARLTAARTAEAERFAELTRTGEALEAAIRVWLAGLRELAFDDIDDLFLRLRAWSESPEDEQPWAAAARARHTEVARSLAAGFADARRRHAELTGRIDALRRERERLEAGEHEPPPTPPTRDAASRAGRPGAPLWRLCDFADDVDPQARAGLEAALEAAGLLDAWVTPTGALLAGDALDTVLVAGTCPIAQRPLASVLRPARELAEVSSVPISAEVVTGILDRIGADVDDGAIWVAADGRFQLGPLRGRWHKPAAQHIGASAREAARRRRLRELAEEIAGLESELAVCAAECAEWKRRQQVLDHELSTLPKDQPVRKAWSALRAAQEVRGRAQQDVAAAERDVMAAHKAQQEAEAERDRFAAEFGLGPWIGDLDGYKDRLHAYDRAATALWPAIAEHVRAAEHVREAQSAAEQCEAQASAMQARVSAAEQTAVSAETKLRTLQETVGAAVAEIQGRLTAARAEQERLQKALRDLEAKSPGLIRDAATIAAAVTNLEQAQDGHEQARARAIIALQRLSNLGLLRVACPTCTVPEGPTWSPRRAVDLARDIEEALHAIGAGDEAWARVEKGLYGHGRALEDSLLNHQFKPEVVREDDLYVVTVPFQGQQRTMLEFRQSLDLELDSRRAILSAREREILENHLLGEVAVELHNLVHEASKWVDDVNGELLARPMSTGMTLKFVWEPQPDGPPGLAEVRELLRRRPVTWSPAERETVGTFLQRQIQRLRSDDQGNAPVSTRDALVRALDYRQWHRFTIHRKQDDGAWKPLTRRTYGTGSGGEKAIALTIPQFAAAAAHYRSADPLAPRLILLDEAFVGVDNDMRAKCMGLLEHFDLDFVMTSEREWGCYPTISGVSICQLATLQGVDAIGVTRFVWNGKRRIQVELDSPRARPQLELVRDPEPAP